MFAGELSGLLDRNPETRLGASMNPPSDVMWSDFFKGLDWGVVYRREIPGPWVPKTPYSGGGSETRPLEEPSMDLERPSMATNSMRDMRERDSIIAPSREMKNQDTSIPDWSFLDASVLRTLASDGGTGDRGPSGPLSTKSKSAFY